MCNWQPLEIRSNWSSLRHKPPLRENCKYRLHKLQHYYPLLSWNHQFGHYLPQLLHGMCSYPKDPHRGLLCWFRNPSGIDQSPPRQNLHRYRRRPSWSGQLCLLGICGYRFHLQPRSGRRGEQHPWHPGGGWMRLSRKGRHHFRWCWCQRTKLQVRALQWKSCRDSLNLLPTTPILPPLCHWSEEARHHRNYLSAARSWSRRRERFQQEQQLRLRPSKLPARCCWSGGGLQKYLNCL